MNEELRSASEELETSREELQSINEELGTVNVELKSKVDELGRANADLQNLMASTSIATVFLDRELRIKRYTPPAITLFNLIPTDAGRPLSDLNSRLEFGSVVADATRVLHELTPIERELGSADGRWYLVRITTYRTAEDHIAGVILTFIDITRRRQAEEAVRESEARFRAIVGQTTAGIGLMDLTGCFVFTNPRLAELLDAPESELTGQPFDRWLRADDRAELHQALRTLEGTSGEFQLQKRLETNRPAALWANISLSAIHDSNGRPQAAVAVVIDVTERHLAEEQLRASKTELERALHAATVADRAKNRFLATLSHELRTPLSPVLILASAASEDAALSGDVRAQFQVIRRNVELEARLIDDLLDLTRISRGKLRLEPADRSTRSASGGAGDRGGGPSRQGD